MATASSPKGKPEPKPAESEPKPKTWVLKVSSECACEGCKTKVKTILTIKGVHAVGIDLKEQKVTVTGNVDSETLLKKFKEKTGKHAELWPQEGGKGEKKPRKDQSEEKKCKPITKRAKEEETVKIEVRAISVEIERIRIEEIKILKSNKINKLRT